MMKHTTTVLGLAAIIAVAGCATPVRKPSQTGFLSDYSRLQEFDENHLVFDSGKLGDYSQFIIEPVRMLYSQPEGERKFTEKELQELRAYVETRVGDALAKDDGYQLVDVPGPETATIRVGITDVDGSIGALNLLIYTKITGAGLGGASMEGEFVDSVTGEQIAAAVRWGSGSRILRAGLTHTGDAKILFNRWAKDFRQRVDEAHGR
ncbi:MAG: DUF3313 domain-containing protein [Gammaproteobacteria bacterium]|nr:DUF3313 domain-containing protein [Gammaproteobacteria bacterium]